MKTTKTWTTKTEAMMTIKEAAATATVALLNSDADSDDYDNDNITIIRGEKLRTN